MGRHGAGQNSKRRARISIPLVAIGVLVLAAIGFGIWLWSLRSVTDPIDAHPVDAYAVVVSSPSCTSDSGTTVVDLAMPPTVRTSLSACGRKVGERLAVQYLDGHPDQVRLAGTTVADNSSLGRWLPIAILGAGLLAVIATIALMIDRRKSRHGRAKQKVTVAQLKASGPVGEPVPAAYVSQFGALSGAAPDTGQQSPGAGTAGSTDDGVDVVSTEESSAADDEARADSTAVNPEVTSRIAVPGLAGEHPIPFRPSEIAVEDDLFTHRGPEASGR